MPKRKPTKHENDILRGIRPPDRYDPKARGPGLPWRMVKTKDGAYVCYEQHLEIIDNLRKNAEINPAQSPHDGIHTCSKGCSKPGCNRGLRDTIEEQDAQIVALKQDLLEKSAELRRLHQERVHELNQIGGLQEENARLKADFHQAHDERADYAKDVSKLKAEVGRLKMEESKLLTLCETYEGDLERLRNAGDAMASALILFEMKTEEERADRIKAWSAAKEGKQP